MPFLARGDARLYYEVYGDGRPAVFLHGRGGNTLSWWQQVDAFAARYRCVLVDQRGWGRSRGPLPEPWTDAFVPDLEAVLAELGIDAFAVVAQSMGGWTVNAFCAAHPGRIRAAVMSGTTGGYAPPAVRELWRAALARADDARAAWAAGRGPHPAVGARMYREQPALARLYEMIAALNPPPAVNPGTAPAGGERDSIRVPRDTLWVSGAEDLLCPTAVVAAVAACCPGSRVLTVPDAGHSVYFERAAVFNAAALEFLGQVYR